MKHQPCPDDAKIILQAFSRALAREAHVLAWRPDLLWKQVYNDLRPHKITDLTPLLEQEAGGHRYILSHIK